MEELARWGAPVLTTIAALMTASNLGSRVTGWGFAVFLGGSILWTALGAMTGQPNLVWQNVILSLLNIFGMWRWLGRQAAIEKGGEEAHERSEDAPGETLFPVSTLISGKLEAAGGTKIGEVVEAMAGCRSGRIAYLVAGEGGVAGMGERLHRLDWSSVEVDGETLRARLASIEGLPVLEKDNWPAR
jgi:hypothetical protein